MERFRKMKSIFFQQISGAFFKKNVIAGYLLGLFVVLRNAIHYSSFVGNHTVNLAEAYIVNFSTNGDAMLMIIGCIIAMADAPFINAGSFSLLHRVGRKIWYSAMWLYMLVLVAGYYLVMFLASVLVFFQKGYLENAWSQTMLRIVKGNADIMAEYSLAPPNSSIIAVSPYETLAHTMMWILLYTLCLSAILFVFNMKLNKNTAGTVAAGVVHILSMLMAFQWVGAFNLSKWSLFRNAVFPRYYDPDSVSVIFTYCYFLLVLNLIYMAGECLLPYTGFVLNTGGQNE